MIAARNVEQRIAVIDDVNAWRRADGLLPLPEAGRLSWADHFGDGIALTGRAAQPFI